MDKFFHISHSHKEAAEFHRELDSKETPEQRIADMEYLREQYFKIKGLKKDFMVRKVLKIYHRRRKV